ncbi:hypothetical protein ABB37_01921 [Leptomonas pyrrhocoris]|uniref:Uncharacterized protein n=1 Tax=Leptomonas pyrrhocoris TaxID=157538 RepID=A0A0N0VGH7_LEPPY|nr:hypothetical protein ABB37_01921 [Leptomonas pyrrhocoris]KPA83658.1 hypothetical protein ABB37_01921 [Leptomonas pyrrhocoris]|eukprot:XP_015662097.1 hypothetical protein ABB37_01921 [Leptomonas pyrrhocoris]
MDSYPHILRLPGISAATTSFQSDTRQTPSVPDDYVLSEAFVCPLATASAPGDPTAAVSKLNGIAAKYAHFQRSIAPCVLASCNDLASHPKAAASSRTADLSRSPSENAKSAKNAERPKSSGASKPPTAAAATVSIPTSCAPPDLASFWLATSPLPPTAVLTALYSLLPLRRVSVVDSDAHDNSIVSETRAGGEDSEVMRDRKPSTSLETLWTLCRSAESVEKDQRQVSFWEAFCMTAMTVHSVAGTATYGGSAVPSQESSSSASSFSLSQQLRRATAVLGSLQQTSASATAATAPVLSPGTSVLTWPEEFLWNLLMSLLSVVALVHGAGLHFFGQLTASNVLCFACASSLPRLLEQTWQDVVAANGIPKHVASRPDSVALFRRFYSIAGQGVLLPQASLTSETPCHNAFFVVRPSLELMRRRLPQNGADGVKAAKSGKESEDADASVAVTSAAQEAADETPAQQACFQAADLASVGRLLTTVMELRARWSSEGGQSFSSAVAAAPPSSELVFLVRRLCECELTAGSAAAAATTKSSNLPRSGPTALQLLQLQALRLRTETWYYRRAAAEAYDRLAQLQLAQPPLHPVESSVMPAQRAVTEPQTQARTTKEGEGEEKLQAREAAVAEREAKLDLILRVYELTHEHLDAVNLPKSQTPSTDQTESSYRLDERVDKTPARSQTPRDDSLEPSLPARTYLPTTKTAAHAAALRSESRPTPISNISHPPQREAFTHATADTSGEMLLGLSPLVRMSNAEDADVTLLSTSATPFASLYGADERSARSATHPPPWSVPTTHRELQVGEPPAYTAVVAEQQSTEEEGASATTTWATEEARRTPQTAVAAPQGAVADSNNAPRVVARLSPSLPAGEPMYTPWNGSQAQTQQPTQQQQQHQSFHPWEPQRHRDPNSSASAPAPVTVVEVELDDSSDSEDASRTQPNAFSSDAARRWRTQHVAPDEQQVVRATPHGAQLVVSPDPQPPPPPLPPSFFSPTFASPTSRFAPDVQTPVRAPSLPNMGIADADVSGGGRSRSKYSPLAQLRSPPSARRPASASRNADSSLSLSPNSPESYRSSTMPSATVAPAYTPTHHLHNYYYAHHGRATRKPAGATTAAAALVTTPVRLPRQQRQRRPP